MKTFTELKKELLHNKHVAREYEKLTPRYRVISELIAARVNKGITQKELADRIGTKQSAIARLESGNVNPSLAFWKKLQRRWGIRLRCSFNNRLKQVMLCIICLRYPR